jgi:acetolactate synthase-1/2/3 large subunit
MDAAVEGDARVIGALADHAPARDAWAGDLAALGTAIRARIAADPATHDAIVFLEQTETALPSDALVFADMCIAGYWLAGHLRTETPRGLHFPMGWGTLGFAPPAAIGAAAARPNAPTIAFVGDGGMLFGLGELSALAEHRSPCTIVVVDDAGYGMLRYGAAETAANNLPAVDFVQAANAFGIDAQRVDGFGPDYTKALAKSVNAGEPRLLHVRAALHPPVTTTPFWPIKELKEER